jgi:hypothetical protein
MLLYLFGYFIGSIKTDLQFYVRKRSYVWKTQQWKSAIIKGWKRFLNHIRVLSKSIERGYDF